MTFEPNSFWESPNKFASTFSNLLKESLCENIFCSFGKNFVIVDCVLAIFVILTRSRLNTFLKRNSYQDSIINLEDFVISKLNKIKA